MEFRMNEVQRGQAFMEEKKKKKKNSHYLRGVEVFCKDTKSRECVLVTTDQEAITISSSSKIPEIWENAGFS